MKAKILLVAALGLAAALSGNCAVNDTVALPDREKPVFDGKRMVVGYYPTWSAWRGEPDYGKLSMICLAFAQMKGDGHLYCDGLRDVKHVIDNAHKNGVAVVVSLRDAQNVSDALADDSLRVNLAREVKRCIAEYDLDGVDVDYEEWGGDNGAKRRNLEQFYKDIRAEIGDGYLLTAAVGGKTHPDPSIDAGMLKHLDYVFPMVYDLCGGWEGGSWGQVGQHSSMQYLKDVVEFFTTTLEVPKEKLCPGVPFYGYEFKTPDSTEGAVGVPYRELITRFPDVDVTQLDNIGLIWYNGIPTMVEKCRYVVDNNLAGIMIWELSQDTTDPATSLLNAACTTLGK